jgi:hypothetical protein
MFCAAVGRRAESQVVTRLCENPRANALFFRTVFYIRVMPGVPVQKSYLLEITRHKETHEHLKALMMQG